MDDTFTLTSLDSTGRGLRVVFDRLGDRWTHRLEAMENGLWRGAWIAREGDAREPWPLSPALQSLDRSTLPDGREALLLVGMAGTSHWSASIEQGQGGGELVFDIACRMSKLPKNLNQLGSAYVRDGAPLIEFECLQGERHFVQSTPDLLKITPASLPAQLPGTARWRYRVKRP